MLSFDLQILDLVDSILRGATPSPVDAIQVRATFLSLLHAFASLLIHASAYIHPYRKTEKIPIPKKP